VPLGFCPELGRPGQIGVCHWSPPRRAAEAVNADDTFEHLIHQTIDQLERLDFYQQHLSMADLRRERWQNKGLKAEAEAVRGCSQMPVRYNWGGYVVLPANH